jgi:hypothetical protein
MLRLDHLVVVAVGKALRIGKSLLEFGSEFIEAHSGFPSKYLDANQMGEVAAISRPAN